MGSGGGDAAGAGEDDGDGEAFWAMRPSKVKADDNECEDGLALFV